jgi:hypothetical protein
VPGETKAMKIGANWSSTSAALSLHPSLPKKPKWKRAGKRVAKREDGIVRSA